MVKTSINQDDVNKAVWAACDTFRGVVDPSIYRDYVLTMLFLKYISDVWKDRLEHFQEKYPHAPELVEELMKSERFVVPEGADFAGLYRRRHEPGVGRLVVRCLRVSQCEGLEPVTQVFAGE